MSPPWHCRPAAHRSPSARAHGTCSGPPGRACLPTWQPLPGMASPCCGSGTLGRSSRVRVRPGPPTRQLRYDGRCCLGVHWKAALCSSLALSIKPRPLHCLYGDPQVPQGHLRQRRRRAAAGSAQHLASTPRQVRAWRAEAAPSTLAVAGSLNGRREGDEGCFFEPGPPLLTSVARVLPTSHHIRRFVPARLTYRVYLPHNFDPALGGKLPGLRLGHGRASGGDWSSTGASVRTRLSASLV